MKNEKVSREARAGFLAISACLFWGTIISMTHAYTPPACNDTDADQTNNCGPRDTGDAGTRMR